MSERIDAAVRGTRRDPADIRRVCDAGGAIGGDGAGALRGPPHARVAELARLAVEPGKGTFRLRPRRDARAQVERFAAEAAPAAGEEAARLRTRGWRHGPQGPDRCLRAVHPRTGPRHAKGARTVDIQVVDAPEKKRYEARTGEAVAGFAEYRLTDELAVFTHTEVDSAYEGQGVGGALVRGALDDVRRRGLAVLPVCPFVKSWIQRHPDYADLVYQNRPGTGAD
ncbi:hypothetical protein GCM10009834_40560 [Streptomonospora arabica]